MDKVLIIKELVEKLSDPKYIDLDVVLWFNSKEWTIKKVEIIHSIQIPYGKETHIDVFSASLMPGVEKGRRYSAKTFLEMLSVFKSNTPVLLKGEVINDVGIGVDKKGNRCYIIEVY